MHIFPSSVTPLPLVEHLAVPQVSASQQNFSLTQDLVEVINDLLNFLSSQSDVSSTSNQPPLSDDIPPVSSGAEIEKLAQPDGYPPQLVNDVMEAKMALANRVNIRTSTAARVNESLARINRSTILRPDYDLTPLPKML